TLTSPRLDASALVHPVLEWWRWYANRGVIQVDSDPFRTSLSNDDGATWTTLESTSHTISSWRRYLLRIEDVMPPTALMRLRFVAQDSSTNGTVEAAVDDVRLLGLVATAAPDPVAVRELSLAPVVPNPAAGPSRLEYALPAAGRVRLRVLDVAGREVARPVDGDRPAGRHAVEWRGERAAPGLYFVVLDAGGARRVQRLTRLR